MSYPVYHQVQETNAGFRLLDTPALRRARKAYGRLLQQIQADPEATGSTAAANVTAYVAELDGALADREEAAA